MIKTRSVSLNPLANNHKANPKFSSLKVDIANDYLAQLDPIKSFKSFLQRIVDKKNEELSNIQTLDDVEEEKEVIKQSKKSQYLSTLMNNKSN
jgi:hypothetical protein